MFIIGGTAFANNLYSVEITNSDNIGKIILDTDSSSISKSKISNNEISLKLKNTLVLDNVKAKYDNLSTFTDVSIMQNGNDTFINLSGDNISNYQINYAFSGKKIPINNHHLLFIFLLSIFSFSSVFASCKKILNLFYNNDKDILRNTNIEMAVKEKIKNNKTINIKNIQTLRTKTLCNNNSNIHSDFIANFSNSTNNQNMSIPKNLLNENRYMDFSQLKQAVNS
jgi:hypothetical protein